MPSVLIIEDDPDLQQVIGYNLAQAGHHPRAALCGKEGLRLAHDRAPDLVVLDLMLPDLPGTEVCKLLRADARLTEVPVLVLSARGEELDRVIAFELGVDDFVTKPFSVRELVLRVGAILRRSRQTAPGPGTIEAGLLKVDRRSHRVWVAGQEIQLTPLELKLLGTLLDNRNRVLSRVELLAEVWEITARVSTRTVDTHVKRLREKLGSACDYIDTVRGAGYRFTGPPP